MRTCLALAGTTTESQRATDQLVQWHGMPRQRVLTFHRVNGRDRSGKLAVNGSREPATVLACHLAGKSALRPFRTSSNAGARRIGSE